MPYQLLRAIGGRRATGITFVAQAALARLQSTVIATTIRNGPLARRQFSWINEWEK